MPRSHQAGPGRTLLLGTLVAIALAALLAPAAGATRQSKRVAEEAPIPALGRNALTNAKGRTLYSLSAETSGKFICVGPCLSTWRPLLVPAGVRPTGPVRLGTIERPDGRTQATFKGRPLYSFSGDAKAGEANGEGIKDVGTWRAAVTSKIAPTPEAPQPQPESPYPYSY
jgi:predicted lipoprotein with Yx(FWY)xxD motif